jgi:hypothetical protein
VENGFQLRSPATDWFALGFDDNGSGDSDFDDFMGVGHVQAVLPALVRR